MAFPLLAQSLRLVGPFCAATWVAAGDDLTMAIAASFARRAVVSLHERFVGLWRHARRLDAIDIDRLLNLLVEYDDLGLVLCVYRTLVTVLSPHAMV